jgi:hypothetical protein
MVRIAFALVNAEPMTGIEPAYSAWETDVLPRHPPGLRRLAVLTSSPCHPQGVYLSAQASGATRHIGGYVGTPYTTGPFGPMIWNGDGAGVGSAAAVGAAITMAATAVTASTASLHFPDTNPARFASIAPDRCGRSYVNPAVPKDFNGSMRTAWG